MGFYMKTTQAQFNKIIDLLGDALSAEVNLALMTKNDYKTRVESEVKRTFEAYTQAVKALYAPKPYPCSVYDNPFAFKQSLFCIE